MTQAAAYEHIVIERQCQTPEERVNDLQQAINDPEVMRGRARQPPLTVDAELNA
jgi:hypothetical protein